MFLQRKCATAVRSGIRTRQSTHTLIKHYSTAKQELPVEVPREKLLNFFTECEKKLKIKTPTDWYAVSRTQVNTAGGQFIFKSFPSLADALSAAYPDYKWIYCLFAQSKASSSSSTTPPVNAWHDPKHLRDFFTHIGNQLNVKKPDDWYNISLLQIQQIGGGSLTSYYYSLADALAIAYPDQKWIFCLFQRSPKNAWKDQNHLRDFFVYCAEKLNVQKPEDWYNITRNQIHALGGGHVFTHYNSLAEALEIAYPDYKWIYCLFHMCPRNSWKDPKHVRDFFDYIGNKLNIKNLDEWYNITVTQIQEVGGSSFTNYFHSFADALAVAYPEHNWIYCLFNKSPINTWKDQKHIRAYFEYCQGKLGIKKPEEWYKITQNQIKELGGSSLYQYYYSLADALALAYPEHKWNYTQFVQSPKNTWKDPKQVRNFFEYTAKKLEITTPEQWYNISRDQIIANGGRSIYKYYDSLADALAIAYPDYKWIYCLFLRSPTVSWKDPKHLKMYFDYCAKELHIQQPEDWYRISRVQFGQLGGGTLFHVYKTLGAALRVAYPDKKSLFTNDKFTQINKKSSQRWLVVQLKKLLPENTEVIEDYQHPSITWEGNPHSGNVQFDIWVPSMNFALEYQGEQHFQEVPGFGQGGTLAINENRDTIKNNLVKQHNINFLSIPYWWDGSTSSLASALHYHFPKLFPKVDGYHINNNIISNYINNNNLSNTEANPTGAIPSTPPNFIRQVAPGYESLSKQIKNKMMHGREYDWEMDPTGWYMIEKLDGVRAFWNGSQFFSKSGLPLNVPKSFTENFPKETLDGEIWGGYDTINETWAFLRKVDQSQIPENFTYFVFDSPDFPGGIAERHSHLKTLKLNEISKYIKLIPLEEVLSKEHLRKRTKEIEVKHGEGVMIHHPTANYTAGRVSTLLKVKNYLDEDVMFLRLATTSYCFVCKQKNGQECVVKCIGSDYTNPPQPGTVLTVKHMGFHNKSGKLKYPFLIRVRHDLVWEEVLVDK